MSDPTRYFAILSPSEIALLIGMEPGGGNPLPAYAERRHGRYVEAVALLREDTKPTGEPTSTSLIDAPVVSVRRDGRPVSATGAGRGAYRLVESREARIKPGKTTEAAPRKLQTGRRDAGAKTRETTVQPAGVLPAAGAAAGLTAPAEQQAAARDYSARASAPPRTPMDAAMELNARFLARLKEVA